MLLTQLIKRGVETISALYPEGEAKEMVYAFLEHHIGTKRHTHIIEPAYEVPEEKALQAVAAFERMAVGEPMQYVAGRADFYGRQFRVTPDVLIPRQETELLIESSLKTSKTPVRILDLCTGSGCIAWTLALETPGAQVMAADISDGALDVASRQDFAEEMARTGALAPTFFKTDVLAGPAPYIKTYGSDKFDIIVSNPPYVMDKEKAMMRTNVLDHEPHLALFVPDDDPLVFYRAVASWASELLEENGVGIVEINEALGDETADVFRVYGFSPVAVLKDLHDKDRFVKFIKK